VKILLAKGVQRVKMHHRAMPSKSVNPLERYCNFSIFQEGSLLDLFVAYLDHPRRVLGGLYHHAKFGCNQRSSFDNLKV